MWTGIGPGSLLAFSWYQSCDTYFGYFFSLTMRGISILGKKKILLWGRKNC